MVEKAKKIHGGGVINNGTIYTMSNVINLQEDNCTKGKKLYMCFTDPKEGFDSVTWEVLK